MSFFQKITEFFKLHFAPKNSGPAKNQYLRKIETDLSKADNPVYKNGFVQPLFADALFMLYKNTTEFHSLLDFLRNPEYERVKNRVFDTLIQTGYNPEEKERLKSLSHEMRKQGFDENPNRQQETDRQTQIFAEMQRELQSDNFIQIEKTLKNLELFYDVCSFNYISALKIFNNAFETADTKPTFSPVAYENLVTEFLNLYFVTANLEVTGALARAITAILSIVPERKSIIPDDMVLPKMKKISSILKNILSPDTLKKLICLGKGTIDFEPECEKIKTTPLIDYTKRQQANFNADTERLNTEFQDRERVHEIKDTFGGQTLVTLQGYNSENNTKIQDGASLSFLWITPMQIIKTFITYFVSEEIRALLNDIVIEGFFYSADKKTEFSSVVFECLEIKNVIEKFEESFLRNKANDMVLLLSYLQDSQKDQEFFHMSETMVVNINNEAKEIIQHQTTNLYNLYKLLLALSEDSRKSTAEIISNIKILFTSSRNRSRVDFLEKSLPKWSGFLNLMKHYTVLGNIKASREQNW
ncbi:MAG: DUF5312 family protein [Spirochaetales bacterium]